MSRLANCPVRRLVYKSVSWEFGVKLPNCPLAILHILTCRACMLIYLMEAGSLSSLSLTSHHKREGHHGPDLPNSGCTHWSWYLPDCHPACQIIFQMQRHTPESCVQTWGDDTRSHSHSCIQALREEVTYYQIYTHRLSAELTSHLIRDYPS